MLKKAEALPGTKIKFERDPFIAVNPIGRVEMTIIKGYASPGEAMSRPTAIIQQNDTATVIESPKKKYGIMAILLEVNGNRGHFYWTEIYYNASLMEE